MRARLMLPSTDKIFWPTAVALLVIMGAVQVGSARQESQTYDEATHLAAGYSYLRTGDFRMNPEHPALGKMLSALPLLLLQPKLPLEHPTWAEGYGQGFGSVFVYHNRLPAEVLLFAGRSVTIFFTLLLGLVLALWARRHFGAGVALLALLMYAFDPNLIANGHYVTTDLFVTFGMFLACIAWSTWLESRKTRDLIWAGTALGLTLLLKFSGPVVMLFFLLLYAIKWLQDRNGLSWRHLIQSMLVVGFIGGAMILVVYMPEIIRMTTADQAHFVPLVTKIEHRSVIGRLLYSAGRLLHLPAYSYLVGLESAAGHVRIGHPAYLLGQLSQRGWWYYFPVAFAVKTPTAVLMVLFLCLGIVIHWLYRGPWRRTLPRIRELRFAWFVLFVPLIVYGGASLLASMNIGLRHILPVYPFLFVLLAAILFRLRLGRFSRAFPVIVCLLVIAEITESAHMYPDYLAFFNVLSGGPIRGPHYLVDSNLDWGQDFKQLKQWWQHHGEPPICMAYFGLPEVVEYYGIHAARLPVTNEVDARRSLDCIGAISATYLEDDYRKSGDFQWLRDMPAMGNIGYSIYLYDVRKHRPRGTSQVSLERNEDGAGK